MEVTLLVDAGFALATATLTATTGRAIARREARSHTRTALALYAAWWFAISALLALNGIGHAAAGLGLREPAFFIALTYVMLPTLCIALASLGYYLLFVVTGSRRLLAPVIVFYAGFLVWLIYYLTASHPTGVEVSPWLMRLSFANAPSGWPLWITVALMIGPHLAVALWYSRLLAHVHEPVARYRIALVASALVAWFASTIFVADLHIVNDPPLSIASRMVGLAAAVAVYVAYAPPAWVRRRLLSPDELARG